MRIVHAPYHEMRRSPVGRWRVPCMSECDMCETNRGRPVSRRVAARLIAAGAAALVTPRTLLARAASTAARPVALRLGVVVADQAGGATGDPTVEGVRLGAAEASRAASMLGRVLLVREGPTDRLLDEPLDGHPFDVFVFADASRRGCERLGELAARTSVALLDAACGARSPQPRERRVFHVVPSEATLRAAAARAATPGEVVVWHPALERFGAGQLNARYRTAVGTPMTAGAWAGWMAVKIAWESSLRRDATRGESIADFLATARARFDGHKGRALDFDPVGRELRQPLYVVRESDGGVTVEELRPLGPPAASAAP